jgi:hypothetical protein
VEKVKFMVQDFILNNQIFAYLQLLIDLFHWQAGYLVLKLSVELELINMMKNNLGFKSKITKHLKNHLLRSKLIILIWLNLIFVLLMLKENYRLKEE